MTTDASGEHPPGFPGHSVLLVEDDEAVQAALVRTLSARGYRARAVGTAADALREAASTQPDLIVLDLGLPDLDGSAALRMIRGVSDVPVIIASVRREEDSVVRLLNDGADDYVIKPFSGEQLLARMLALLRRVSPTTAPRRQDIEVGGLHIAPDSRIALLEGRELDLTRKEFDLLTFLGENAGRVVTRQAIVDQVWRDIDGGSNQSIDVHVSWLRRKLGESATAPRYVHTVRGVGFKLTEPS
ncbi:response regulator transcription factor [Qaidamihabitans albus]|uniref:response regulator transcription factor n=1 Tax=Qaidamihabitans albus TaxID=2795733 RepID=UPI0018F1117E|nr:response regulator transcription factor [Qaidamihabitans albus]